MVQNTGVNDQVIATNKNPACRDTFLGVRKVGKNINAPNRKVIQVPSKKAVVAPSSAIFEVIRQVDIKTLKPMVTRPKIWTIVRMTFMEAFKVYAASKKRKARDKLQMQGQVDLEAFAFIVFMLAAERFSRYC